MAKYVVGRSRKGFDTSDSRLTQVQLYDEEGKRIHLTVGPAAVKNEEAFRKEAERQLGKGTQLLFPNDGTSPPWAPPERDSFTNAEFAAGDGPAYPPPYIAAANAATRRNRPTLPARLIGVRGPYFAQDEYSGGRYPGRMVALLTLNAGVGQRITVPVDPDECKSEAAFLDAMRRAGYTVTLPPNLQLPWARAGVGEGINGRTVKNRSGGVEYWQESQFSGVPKEVFERTGEAAREITRQGGSPEEAAQAALDIIRFNDATPATADFASCPNHPQGCPGGADCLTGRERLDELLALTPLGQDVLRSRRGE